MTINEFLARLEGVRETSHPQWRWQARCPAHDDTNPSLSVGIGDDGCILLHCWAGCEESSILVRLGLTNADLSPRPRGRRRIILEDEDARPTDQSPVGCTVATLAEFKGLPETFLRSLGLIDISISNAPAVRIPFCDPDGTEQSVLHRLNLVGDPKHRWRSGSRQMLYGLPWLAQARAAGQIVIVEGPSDCWTLRYHRISVIGLPSAGRWDEAWVAYFDGIEAIYAVIERDPGGELVRRNLGRSALRDRVRFVDLGEFKDPSALYLDDPSRFRDRLLAALHAAIPWQQADDARTQAEADAAWQQCEGLAMSPSILDAFVTDLGEHGIVGEERFGKLLYLAVTSRLLPRPVSLAAKGPSSAGKSIVMQRALDFFPARAYYALTGMSERSLAYSKEPVQHRMLVIYEAQGFHGNWAQYLLRSLLSEGRIRYETVMKTERGLESVLIDREGPTGLLVTTTRIFLHPENETRQLSVPVDDSPAQTQRIMQKIAEEQEHAVDFARWHSLQMWLQDAEHRVVIPFAPTLARLIPPVAVRLRRDFKTVLALVQAHALLHQASRARDSAGRIVATLADYGVVRALMADLLAEGVEASVPPIVRETVAAVERLVGNRGGMTATVKQVADELDIDSPAALRRVRMAIARGFLNNEETREHRPYKLTLGDPLPDDRVLLPRADDPRFASPRAPARGNGRDAEAEPAWLPDDLPEPSTPWLPDELPEPPTRDD